MKTLTTLFNALAIVALWLPQTVGSSIPSIHIRLPRGGSSSVDTPETIQTTESTPAEKDAWTQFQTWQQVSERKRNEVRHSRLLKLRLTVLGTTLHTLGNNAKILARKQLYNFGGSACLFFVSLSVKRHLSKDDIETDVNSRMLANSIKSEFYKSMLKVGQYANLKKKDELLRKKVEDLRKKYCKPHMELEFLLQKKKKKVEELPSINMKDGKQWYLDTRLKPEMKSMKKKSKSFSWKNNYFGRIESTLTSAAALIGVINNASSGDDGLAIVKVVQSRLGLWSPLIAAAATSIASYLESSNFEINAEKVAATANLLGGKCESVDQTELTDFVTSCEGIMMNYTKGWVNRMGGTDEN